MTVCGDPDYAGGPEYRVSAMRARERRQDGTYKDEGNSVSNRCGRRARGEGETFVADEDGVGCSVCERDRGTQESDKESA